MMKFYQKKEVSQEKTPILFRLERRHTLLEGGKDEGEENEPTRASRANSVGSYSRSDTPTEPESKAKCLSDDKRSNFSAGPTVVITESELSSSWLYKNRKAKIDSEENINSESNLHTDDPDNIEPVQLNDPNLKPIPVPISPRPEKLSSCCCYLIVAVTICVASLGILAAIGGIIYLEVFSVYKEAAEAHNTIQEPVSDVDQSTPYSHSDLQQNNISIAGFRNFERNASDADLQLREIILLEGKDNFTNEKGINKNEDFSNESDSGVMFQNPILDKLKSEIIDTLDTDNVDESSKSVDDQLNSKIMDPDSTHPDIEAGGNFLHVHANNPIIYDPLKEIDNSVTINSNFGEFKNHIEMGDPTPNVQVSQNSNLRPSTLENNRADIETNNNSNVRLFETKLDSDSNSGLPGIGQEHISFNNSLNVNEGNKSNIKSPNFSVNKDMASENEFDPHSRNIFEPNIDQHLELNTPAVEVKPPIDFKRSSGTDQNTEPNQPLTVKDMDMKFSLSEILKHLRTLDVNNQLSSSRQKSITVETVSSNLDQIIHQDAGSERKQYLQNLRKRMFD